MALKRENYTHMGIGILVYLCTILSLSAQYHSCPIWADLEPNADRRTATPTIYSQSVSIPFTDWEQLDSSRLSDDKYASVTIPGIQRSEIATFSRWGHKIPEGATIQGILLTVEGHQSGNGKIRDVKVQLQGSNENKAGQFLGVAFPDDEDQVWRYGGANDTWGRDWTADDINRSNFGLLYQVRNSLNTEVTAHIDQITLEIFYTPMYKVCNVGHVCVAFGVDEVPGNSYNWHIPQGFQRLSSLNEQYAVNIGPKENTAFGEYNLCVDVIDQTGVIIESCCRSFRYDDCRPAFIGDQVFLDNNDDNIFSAGDEGVPNVTVFLFDEFDNFIDMTTTDENDGTYQFEVEEGNYYVGITLPDGTLPIEPNVGNENNDSDLSDANGPLTTQTFFAAAGTTVDNVDIGLATELIIGDRVWEDKNYNGIQDTLEVGIAGIDVQLIAANGDTLQTTTTNTDGIYSFDGIRVNDYEVRFLAEDNYLATLDNVGADNLDSDIDQNRSTGIIDFSLLEMPFLDLDAGFYRFASVGDFVFFDNNENGIQDADDVPLDSVTVILSTSAGTFIESIIPEESGIYLFDSLLPGEYVISVLASDLIKPTFAQQGDDSTLDSDLINHSGNYATDPFKLMSNEINNDIDLGFRDNLADIGGSVFEDIKYDGQLDTTDILLSNILVSLLTDDGSLVETQLTDANGNYMFMNVLPGLYYIIFGVGDSFQFTQANIGSELTDSDVTESVSDNSTDLINVTVGLEMFDINAGLYSPVSIGDYVFLDLNEDGIQNVGDTGLSGIELILFDEANNEVARDTTAEDGVYIFNELVPGVYTIELTSQDLYLATIAGQGNESTDSDLIDNSGQLLSEIITTCSGQEIDTIDFGFINNYAVISGQLFEDSKADALFDNGDTLLVSVPVMLYDTTGNLVQTVITDTLGSYTFDDVLAGDYYIVYALPDNYIFSTSDITLANGLGSTDDFNVAPGQVINDLSTGAYIPASVGDFIFLDLDEDGIQSNGDEGLAALVMELRTANGEFVASRGSVDGFYIFSDLIPGDYVINFVKDDLYLPTLSNVGNDEVDSDLLEIGNLYTSGVFTLCSGQQVDTLDFGFINNYAQISGQVFEDNKADGQFTADDTLIINIPVILYDTLDQIVQTTFTDSLGSFTFVEVLAGEYYIQYGLSTSYVYTTSNVTETNGIGSTDRFVLAPGEISNSQNTGAYIPASIGDFIFLDIDEDGIQDVDDVGLAGIELSLLDNAGTEILTIESTTNGSYVFDGLVPGTYTISVSNSDLFLSTLSDIGDDNLDSDLLGETGNYSSPEIVICSGQSDDTIDFGFVNNFASLSGVVYEDSKADSTFNVPDTALVAIPVTLYNSDDQVVQSTITDANGAFIFDDVLAGNYYVIFGLGNEYIYTTDNVTGTNGVGSTDVITLAPGEINNSQTTGAYVPGSIGDFVFLDINENGIQDVDDTGLAGIELSLLDNAGTEILTIESTTNGSYVFDGLVPGIYTINIANSDLFLSTLSNVGDDNLDSDLIGESGNYSSPEITICSGQSDDTIDFGFVNNFATLSGIIYEDSKADRTFNMPDTALVAIPVTLYDSDDQVVQTTVTDASGAFIFDDVLAGDYYVIYGLGSEYIYSTDNVTGANGIGSTNIISLAPGEVNVDQSTGAYVTATVGDFVFLDLNENGIQDNDDEGLAGIELSIANMSGTVMGTLITGADGFYEFIDLVPGEYVISAAVSDLFLPTLLNVGNDTIDSDLQSLMGAFGVSPFSLCSGQNEQTIDLGLVNNFANISGQLYEDSKADSLFNGLDTAVVAVEVILYNTDNEIIQTTTTDQNGIYTFDDILAGEYYTLFAFGEDYIYTSDIVTADFGTGTTSTFTSAPGESIIFDPIGAYRQGSIGDFIFLDLDEDGTQSDGDIGLIDIDLELFDTQGNLISATQSGLDGSYFIDNIVPGDYILVPTFSDLYLVTLSDIGNDTTDSDLLTINGLFTTEVISICSGQNDNTVDLGFINNYAQVNGSLYEDVKADGVQDMQDSSKVGVIVELYNTNDEIVQSTITNEFGSYIFSDVLAGDYYIAYDLSSQFIYSTSDVTGDNGQGTTSTFTLLPGDIVDNDATGVYRNASIGDLVFLDQDEDGLQSAEDVGLSNVELILFNENGLSQETVLSDTEGKYSFDNITPGKYVIQANFPNDFLATIYQNGDENLDSDLIDLGDFYFTDTLNICSGQFIDNIDFGLVNNFAEIGGVVFTDQLVDGQRDTSDPGISQISVTLFASNGSEVATTNTAADGSYIFENVLAGDYFLVFDVGDLIVTTANIGDDLTDSDVIENVGIVSTDIITLTPGESNQTVFAGVYELVSLGDFVWADDNRNGVQDATEPGIADVVVNLNNELNQLIAKDTTDTNGIYGFSDFLPGIYYVEFEYPQDLTATVNTSTDLTINSDITDANGTGTTDLIVLTSGENNLDIDAGLGLAGAEIHGEVWIDIDGDEMQSAVDTLLPNIPVDLFNADNNALVFSTTTNQNGKYSFKPLDDGNYYVEFHIADTLLFVTPSVGDESVDSDVETTFGAGTTDVISVVIGDVVLDVDAGVVDARSQISGQVFIDKNGDGINNDTEINLETYTVNLFNVNDEIIKTVTSDIDGNYVINDISTGEYYLSFSVADNFEFTVADVAGDDTIDSDVTDRVAGITDVFTLGIQDAQAYDAGVYELGSIGDFVWFDTNGNGLQDTNDSGVEFVNLTILNMAGEAVDVVNTAADGAYLFDGLAPGRYWIFIQAPLGLKATEYQVGNNADIDSDLLEDGAFLLSDTIMIMSGQNDLTIDFGFVENPGSIEGLVWNDENLDGVFNESNQGIATVTVELFDDNNVLIDNTTTGTDGAYIFSDVAPGNYYVKFNIDSNAGFTIADQVDDDVDSDVTESIGIGTTDVFTLLTGESITNVYAGIIQNGKIGDFVFLDQNSDGLQDADDIGLPMIKVILYNEADIKLDSVITDIAGGYQFADLEAGNYYLEFVYPDAIQPTISIPNMPDTNSDITGVNGEGTTGTIFVGSAVCREDIDAGFVPTGAVIVGEVWLDTDGDNIQDNPNNPVEGIAVTLHLPNDEVVAGPIFTNELGMYVFSSIPTGSYYVGFDIPDSLDFVDPFVGPADTDSDVTNIMASGSTDPFIVLDGELYDNVDAGVRDIRSTIQGQLFVDTNGDGVKDSNNQGLANVEVTLFTGAGAEVISTVTDTNGNYSFDNLQAGDYFVQFSNFPATYFFTQQDVGTDDTIDSDIDPDNDSSSTETLTFDEVITIDGGVYELASIGDFVWIDENENGIQDTNEPGQEGVIVQVINDASMVVGTSTTDQDGMYLIDGLVPGTYSLLFTGVENYIPTVPNVGGDDTIDSDIIPQGTDQAVTGTFDIVSGEMNSDFDAGYVFSQLADAVISGLAWTDSDGDGIRQSSNPLLENIVVQLFNALNVEQASTVTNADGEYQFTGLIEGDYYIVFQSPIGTSPTLANVGNMLTDSDITEAITVNSTNLITLGPSEVLGNIDGGFISVGTIGNQVWIDINGNGRKGSNEIGLNGVTVRLFDAETDVELQSTVTSADIGTMMDGIYQFNDVILGTYYITYELPEPYLFTDANSGNNDEIDSDVTQGINGAGSTDDFTLASGQVRTDIDAGVFLPAQLGDFVWNDLNEDGIQDAGEPGVANIDVTLKRSNGLIVANTTTNALGAYCFEGLKGGLYLLEFDIPQGFVVSPRLTGNDPEVDSDIDETGVTPLIVLANGVSLKNVDAGIYQSNGNNLRSHVWFDNNSDGLFQLGESNVKDVVINLIDDQGTLVAQQTTNQAGRYAFVDIPHGDYQISVGIDDGFATTIMNAGSDDMIDSDVNENGMSEMFTVNNGLSVPNIDIGLIDDDGFTEEVTDGPDVLVSNEEDSEDNGAVEIKVPVEFVSGPNPFYNRIQIRMSRMVSDVAYQIIRLDGALVQSGSITTKDQWLELDGQTDGMYILIVTHKGELVDKQYLMKVN